MNPCIANPIFHETRKNIARGRAPASWPRIFACIALFFTLAVTCQAAAIIAPSIPSVIPNRILRNPTNSYSYSGVVGTNRWRASGGRLQEVFQFSNGELLSLREMRGDAHPNKGWYEGGYAVGEDNSFIAFAVAGQNEGNTLPRFGFIIGSAEDNEWQFRDQYMHYKNPLSLSEVFVWFDSNGAHFGTNDMLATFVQGQEVNLTVANVDATAVGAFWKQTSTRVITNTTSATTFFGTGTGTTNLPAAFLSDAGRTLVVDFLGRYSTAGTPGTFTIEVALGGSTIATTGAFTPVASQTEKLFHLQVRSQIRAVGSSGTIMSVGRFDMHSATSTLGTFPMLHATGSTVAIDTTAALALHVRGTMSATTAPNNLQIQVGSVYIE
jgi:hypothetical protein